MFHDLIYNRLNATSSTDSQFLCDSINNQFIPLLYLRRRTSLIRVENKIVLYYNHPDESSYITNEYLKGLPAYKSRGEFDRILYAFREATFGDKTFVQEEIQGVSYYGSIKVVDEGLVICLAIPIDKLMKLVCHQGSLKNSDLVLFIKQSIIGNEKYKKFYKKFETKLINPLRQENITTIFTDDIERWCLNKRMKFSPIPHFSSISEKREFLKTLNYVIYGGESTLIRELNNPFAG